MNLWSHRSHLSCHVSWYTVTYVTLHILASYLFEKWLELRLSFFSPGIFINVQCRSLGWLFWRMSREDRLIAVSYLHGRTDDVVSGLLETSRCWMVGVKMTDLHCVLQYFRLLLRRLQCYFLLWNRGLLTSRCVLSPTHRSSILIHSFSSIRFLVLVSRTILSVQAQSYDSFGDTKKILKSQRFFDDGEWVSWVGVTNAPDLNLLHPNSPTPHHWEPHKLNHPHQSHQSHQSQHFPLHPNAKEHQVLLSDNHSKA